MRSGSSMRVELLVGKDPPLAGDLAHRLAGRVRLLGDGGGGVVADHGGERGAHRQALLDRGGGALAFGLDAHHAALG